MFLLLQVILLQLLLLIPLQLHQSLRHPLPSLKLYLASYPALASSGTEELLDDAEGRVVDLVEQQSDCAGVLKILNDVLSSAIAKATTQLEQIQLFL